MPATINPDVASVFGTDETILYNHYITCGKNEGRIPCENGIPFMEVDPLETPVKQEVNFVCHLYDGTQVTITDLAGNTNICMAYVIIPDGTSGWTNFYYNGYYRFMW